MKNTTASYGKVNTENVVSLFLSFTLCTVRWINLFVTVSINMCKLKKGLSPQKQIFMPEKKFPSLPLADIYVEKNKSLRTENINICHFLQVVPSQWHKYMLLLFKMFSHKFTNDFLLTSINLQKQSFLRLNRDRLQYLWKFSNR